MAEQGFALLYNKEDVKKFQKLMRDKQKKISNLAYPMRKLAMIMHKSVMQNFIEQGRPTKWVGLKASTLARRRKGGSGAKILMDIGTLRQSVTSMHDKKQAKVGTNLIYARIHHYGSGAKFPKMNIPERPYMILQDKDKPIIKKIVVDYLKGK